MMKRLHALLLLIVVGGCAPLVPATVPAQLAHTPGPPVVITTETYHAEPFSARYPGGWQVVTSAAFSSPWVVFVAPGGDAVIGLAIDPEDANIMPPGDPAGVRRATRALFDGALTATVAATPEAWDAAQAAFAQVVESVALAD